MSKETIYLEGLVLHSPEARLELSRQFYQTLLDVPFKLEQHDRSPQHYSCWLGKTLLELYPPSPEKKPSSEMKISSFALDFSTLDTDTVVKKMQAYSFQPKAPYYGGKTTTFSDPEERNIRLHNREGDVTPNLRLDEVVLHTRDPSETRLFYQQLLNTPFTEQSYGTGQVPFYSGKNSDIVLKLWPDNVYVAPSPSLLFSCSALDQVKARMEKYSLEWKALSEGKARLLDPDNRKIFLSQK